MQLPPSHLVVLGIDPGTETMGVAVLGLDLCTLEVFAYNVLTLHASHRINPLGVEAQTYGDRFARLNALGSSLQQICAQYNPHSVIAESPFLGRFPGSFEALVDCLSVVRRAIAGFDPSLLVETVDPPSAKKAVGVNPKGSTKEDIRDAVFKLPIIRYPGVYFEHLEEHATDAIAVAYYRIRQIKEQLVGQSNR